MACTVSDSSLFQQVICILDELNVVYTDCDGVIQGDCGMCAGTEGAIVTNSVIFNPASNQLTTIVNGIASSAVITLDTTDVRTSGALTVNGVVYATGTTLQSILSAIIAFGHKAATLNAINNPALSLNVPNQVLKLDLTTAGSYNNTTSGLTANNIQAAIDEIVAEAVSLPSAFNGDVLVYHSGNWIASDIVREKLTGITGNIINLAVLPLPGSMFILFRNGVYQDDNDDYFRFGTVINVVINLIPTDKITAIYYT